MGEQLIPADTLKQAAKASIRLPRDNRMSKRNLQRQQSKGLTRWHETIRSANVNQVGALLAAGADINALDEHGQTALMNAVYWGNFEIAKLLVERGADLNHKAKLNLTALFLAVINNRPEFVRLLVEAGADINIKGSKGQFDCTPLEYAQDHGNHEIVRIIQQKT